MYIVEDLEPPSVSIVQFIGAYDEFRPFRSPFRVRRAHCINFIEQSILGCSRFLKNVFRAILSAFTSSNDLPDLPEGIAVALKKPFLVNLPNIC